jgi:hypothetical protein
MITKKFKQVLAFMLLCLLFQGTMAKADAIIADHLASAAFDLIPEPYIQQVKSDYRIFYGRLSHGDQIPLGMEMILEEDSLYSFNNGAGTLHLELYASAIYLHNTDSWMAATRNRLNQPGNDINIVMWSWCSDVSIADSVDIANYLANFTQLENEYPDVTFIYMTGHVDGTGPSGNLYVRNNQIRDYVITNDKVLYDYADVESWDPDGVYYPYADESCTWCGYWCLDHPSSCPDCDLCWHTACLNCYLKGKAFWGMMAMIAGWDLPTQGTEENTALAKAIFISQNYPNPFNNSTILYYNLNMDSDVAIDVLDLLGRRVETLVDEEKQAGRYQIVWDASDFSSGVYFYRIKAGDFTKTRKMILMK